MSQDDLRSTPYWNVETDSWAPGSGGGGSSSSVHVRGPFDFAYNTPGVNDGVVVWTPTVGDVLLNAWIEIATPFNGTNPLADIGQFGAPSDNYGLWGGYVGAVFLTAPDDNSYGPNTSQNNALSLAVTGFDQPVRIVPGSIDTADPFLLVVSQDGRKGGAAVGGSAGAGRLYLVTATPEDL